MFFSQIRSYLPVWRPLATLDWCSLLCVNLLSRTLCFRSSLYGSALNPRARDAIASGRDREHKWHSANLFFPPTRHPIIRTAEWWSFARGEANDEDDDDAGHSARFRIISRPPKTMTCGPSTSNQSPARAIPNRPVPRDDSRTDPYHTEVGLARTIMTNRRKRERKKANRAVCYSTIAPVDSLSYLFDCFARHIIGRRIHSSLALSLSLSCDRTGCW